MKYSWRDLARGVLDIFTVVALTTAGVIEFWAASMLSGYVVLVAAFAGTIFTAGATWTLLQIGAASRDRDTAKKGVTSYRADHDF